MVCKEAYNPYDRIKVTKVLDASIAKFQLRSDDFYKVCFVPFHNTFEKCNLKLLLPI